MPPASARLSLPTVPAGLEPAASAARPRAQRRLPIDPPGLQPSGSAQPQPPPPTLDQPQLAAPPPQLAASATTGGAGRGLKRKMTPSVGDDQGSEAMAAGRQMVADSTRRIAETGVTAATHPMAARPHARDTPRDAVDLLPPPPPGTTWRWQPSHINADGALALGRHDNVASGRTRVAGPTLGDALLGARVQCTGRPPSRGVRLRVSLGAGGQPPDPRPAGGSTLRWQGWG